MDFQYCIDLYAYHYGMTESQTVSKHSIISITFIVSPIVLPPSFILQQNSLSHYSPQNSEVFGKILNYILTNFYYNNLVWLIHRFKFILLGTSTV